MVVQRCCWVAATLLLAAGTDSVVDKLDCETVNSSSGGGGPPTKEDPTYAMYAYGLPEGFYENCTTTQAEAIAMFTKYNELHDPCEWAKLNGPFNCERAGPTGIGQRFSLAYANALLAYTVISATIVNIFYAKAKRRAEGKDVEKGIEEVEFVDAKEPKLKKRKKEKRVSSSESRPRVKSGRH